MLRNLKSFSPSELEEKVLSLWKEKHIFQKSITPKKGVRTKTFYFWEGPPYANGRPGIHHILSRVMKDVFLRYKTMQGFVVPRKAGWDTHGLPIEIAAEKALGISTKKEIEALGIERFNEKAKESIFKYKDEWEKLTDRIGYWLDLDHAYVTYTPDFVESLWWVFKSLYDKNFLKEFYKVTPYCPRCQTTLANHELGQPGVYKTVPDPSVFVLFPLKGKKDEYLLVWTTTPWTLSANVAIALSPTVAYTKYQIGEKFVWAHTIPESALQGVTPKSIETIAGKDMIGWEYEPLYDLRVAQPEVQVPVPLYTVLGGDFVSTGDGTGLVHIAPTFGEDDFALVFSEGMRDAVLPHTVEADGTVSKGFVGEGLFVKDADKMIVKDLDARGLLFFFTKAEHEYPFCWRCSTPLLYMARTSWFFEVSRVRAGLTKANSTVNWVPAYLKEGRFGEWIGQAKDWAISRERFWGTPLPIWRCDACGKMMVAGSLEDLNTHRVRHNTFLFMRHGEATANVEKRSASAPETKEYTSVLTQKGITAVRAQAKKLAQEGVDIIFASPLHRTQETAAIVAETTGADVVTDDRLIELQVGVFNNKPVEDFLKTFPDVRTRFSEAPEGGETLRDVRKRVTSFIKDVDARYHGKKILIVSHGDPLWMLEAIFRHATDQEAVAKNFPYMKPATFKEVAYDNFPIDEYGYLDIHRPYVDTIELLCSSCRHTMHRVPDVADVWFDSGSMPYGSTHFPFGAPGEKMSATKTLKASNVPTTPPGFPADFICEGIDQTRGWFYTLMAVAVMLGLGTPYKNVLSLGLVLDKNGQKMSKSKGNVVDPWSLIQTYGVDAIRWYFYTVNSPAEPKNFNEQDISKASRRFLMVLYNSYTFLHLYGKDKLSIQEAPASDHPLDVWIVARLAACSREVKEAMDAYDVVGAASCIEQFIDDLSRWYIRRSRRRFQKPDDVKDWKAASGTLAYVLLQTSKIIAPFTPFFAEELYQSLAKSYTFKKDDSVHITLWPTVRSGASDKQLMTSMAWIRGIASGVLAQRASAGIKVRQPLGTLTIKGAKLKGKFSDALLAIVADEVNVKSVVFNAALEQDFVLDTVITPALKMEGVIRELTRVIQDLRQAAGYVPKDVVELYVVADSNLIAMMQHHEASLCKDVGAKRIVYSRVEKFDAEIETKVDTYAVWIGIKKVK